MENVTFDFVHGKVNIDLIQGQNTLDKTSIPCKSPICQKKKVKHTYQIELQT